MLYPTSPFIKYPAIATFINPKWTKKEIERYTEWLCTTPQLTTLRVNNLKTNITKLQQNIVHNLTKTNSIVPNIEPFSNDVLKILNSNSNKILKPISDNKEIIVDVTCAASILRGAHLYAPGVLGMTSGTALDECVNIFADIQGKCKQGTNKLFESIEKVFIGIGIVKMQRHQLFGLNLNPSGIAVRIKKTISGVPSIGDNFFPPGNALLQNLPSIICCQVLNPISGDTVLDMCASPGNKTTYLCELMNDQGLIIALDKNQNKLKILTENLAMFDLNSVHCFAFDSTKAIGDNERTNLLDGPPYAYKLFDKILLDAPCSALGMRPQLRNNISPKMLRSYPIVQKKLMAAAVELLKDGGTLVYSTCTVTVAENEGLVRWALDNYPNLQLVAAEPIIGGPGWEGVGLNDEDRNLVQRFGPTINEVNQKSDDTIIRDHLDTVGFFIAKFKKI